MGPSNAFETSRATVSELSHFHSDIALCRGTVSASRLHANINGIPGDLGHEPKDKEGSPLEVDVGLAGDGLQAEYSLLGYVGLVCHWARRHKFIAPVWRE